MELSVRQSQELTILVLFSVDKQYRLASGSQVISLFPLNQEFVRTISRVSKHRLILFALSAMCMETCESSIQVKEEIWIRVSARWVSALFLVGFCDIL